MCHNLEANWSYLINSSSTPHNLIFSPFFSGNQNSNTPLIIWIGEGSSGKRTSCQKLKSLQLQQKYQISKFAGFTSDPFKLHYKSDDHFNFLQNLLRPIHHRFMIRESTILNSPINPSPRGTNLIPITRCDQIKRRTQRWRNAGGIGIAMKLKNMENSHSWDGSTPLKQGPRPTARSQILHKWWSGSRSSSRPTECHRALPPLLRPIGLVASGVSVKSLGASGISGIDESKDHHLQNRSQSTLPPQWLSGSPSRVRLEGPFGPFSRLISIIFSNTVH